MGMGWDGLQPVAMGWDGVKVDGDGGRGNFCRVGVGMGLMSTTVSLFSGVPPVLRVGTHDARPGTSKLRINVSPVITVPGPETELDIKHQLLNTRVFFSFSFYS